MKNKESKGKKSKKSCRRKRSIRAKGKTSIRILTKKITDLNKILPCLNIPINKASVKYLSDLYSETLELVTNITAYMVQKKYCGICDTIDNSVIRVQELIGVLKEFKILNEGKTPEDDFQRKASSLLQALNAKMGELIALKRSTVEKNDYLTQN